MTKESGSMFTFFTLGSEPINCVYYALAILLTKQEEARRKYNYFQEFSTHSDSKMAEPKGFEA